MARDFFGRDRDRRNDEDEIRVTDRRRILLDDEIAEGEEAVETCLAAVAEDKTALANESADLLYHLLVLWAACDLEPSDVYSALAAREGSSGLDEKASRKN